MPITLMLELRCDNDDCIVSDRFFGDERSDCIVRAIIHKWIIDEKNEKTYCSKQCAKEAKKHA